MRLSYRLTHGLWTLVFAFALLQCSSAQAQTREELVRQDREKVTGEGFWIYNDLDEAFRQAKATGKPIVVVLRCIPCHECVKLDDELVDRDPVIRPLLEQFVCVRQVSTNGLDLDVFQYDTDQSFAVFFLNADKTIYGRFGTRSHRTEWLGDVSLPGLAEALKGALELHAQYPGNADVLAGKRGKPLEFSTPEQYPLLREKYTDTLNYEGNVAQSCIHCHQIGDARRDFYWSAGKPIPERIVFPYPHPKSLGLILNPDQRASVRSVVPDSVAADAGFQAGDQIRAMNGQPLLSIADVQWIFDQTDPKGGTVHFEVVRDDQPRALTMHLESGWRRADDLSWRVSSWGYRGNLLGGMFLESIDAEQRQAMGLDADTMALRAKSVGRYGKHGAARRAGVRPDDVLVAYDGQTDLMREQDVFWYALNHKRPGDQVELRLIRGKRPLTIKIPIQR